MRDSLQKQLQEISRLSRSGVSERTLETRVVLLMERLGWLPEQIEQDVPLTKRGNDRADVVVRVNDRQSILVEVKRYSETQGADEQIRRYCMLLSPRPRLAFLTDGVQWSVFYTSQNEVRKLFSGDIDKDAGTILNLLLVITPERTGEEDFSLRFDFLDVVDQGLSRLSINEQFRLSPCYIATVMFLLGAELPTVMTEVKAVTPKVEPKAVLKDDLPPIQSGALVTLTLDVFNPPLRYSKMRGTVAGTNVTSWRNVVHVAIKSAVEAGMTASEIRNISFVNLREEHFVEDGFAPVTGTTISVQAMEANRSWNSAFALIQRLKVPVEVFVEWSDKANENWRGKHGVLRWTPMD